MVQWNIARFAESLLPLISQDPKQGIKPAEDIIKTFPKLYKTTWLKMMKRKLGIFGKDKEDENIVNNLLNLMEKNSMDYTNTFKDLTYDNISQNSIYESDEFKNWHKKFMNRVNNNLVSKNRRFRVMQSNNPFVIPRNHKVEEAIKEAQNNNLKPLREILSILKKPYTKIYKEKELTNPPNEKNRVYTTFCGT